MKRPSPELLEWIGLAEKALLVLTLAVGIIVSAYKAVEYFSAKTDQARAAGVEAQSRAEAIDKLTNSYVEQIAKIDEELKLAGFSNSAKPAVFVEKMTPEMFAQLSAQLDLIAERQRLITKLGNHIVELNKSGNTP